MTAVNVGGFIAEADAALSKLDAATIKRLSAIILAEYNKLEAELRKLYNTADKELSQASREFREARARILIQKLKTLLELMKDPAYAKLMEQHIDAVTKAELQQATKLVSAFGAAQTAQVPVQTITTVSSNIGARLAHHGAAFALAAEEVIVAGLINGQGFGKMASELRKKTGILRSRAEMIVRTETMRASDIARRASYQKNGVDMVMRIATQDSRVCGYCLARAGNVYRVDEAPQSLHPNDRCYNAPFKPEWLEAGLIDVAWVRKHRSDAAERSTEQPRTGAATFEKSAGISPPEPIWTPMGGYR